ncbi:radical SAM protein [Candidatus Micrarchaeota archaeon]|nr:radical SAM protein [Candidatus Micrarchaeota archaeon]
MRLRFSSILEHSLVDYPGKVASVVFFGGCPLRCGWCNTPNLLNQDSCITAPTSFFVKHFAKQRQFIDAVCFNGGEPLTQGNALLELSRVLKQNAFLIKIESNGYYPEALAEMLPHVDFVALDVKTRLDNAGEYARVCGFDKKPELLLSNVLRALAFLETRGTRVFKEIRFTVVPGLNDDPEILKNVCKHVKFADVLALQQFSPRIVASKEFESVHATAKNKLMELAEVAKEAGVENVIVRLQPK